MRYSLCVIFAFLVVACGEKTTTKNKNAENLELEVTEGDVVLETDEADIVETSGVVDFSEFVLDGYILHDSQMGDLNKDEYDDALLVLIQENEDELEYEDLEEGSRPLIILTGNADGSFTKVNQNDYVVLCKDCGGVFGDPYDGLAIKNGYFTVEHYGGSSWRWTKLITFKYNKTKKNWFLHRDGGVSYHTSEPDKVEEEVQTTKDFGVVPFESYGIDSYEEE